MKKFKLDKTYFTIAVYALIVIAFCLVFAVGIFHLRDIGNFIGWCIKTASCLFYGIFFTFCFLPPVRVFERGFAKVISRKKDHPVIVTAVSALSVEILFVALIALIAAGVVPAVSNAYTLFSEMVTDLQNTPEWIASTLERIPFLRPIYDKAYNFIFVDLQKTIVDTLTGYATTIASEIFNVLIGLVFSAYFLIYRRRLTSLVNKMMASVLPANFHMAFAAVVRRIYTYFVEFFSSRLICGIYLAILSFLLFLPFKVPFAAIISLLVFIANFIPVLGPILVTLASFLLMLLLSPRHAAAVFIILAAIHILDNLLVEPLVLRKKLRPNIGVVVVILFVFGALFGFLGVVFAVPLYTSLLVAFREIQARLLVRKSLPLNNDYYMTLSDLPGDEKDMMTDTVVLEDLSNATDSSPDTVNDENGDESPSTKEDKEYILIPISQNTETFHPHLPHADESELPVPDHPAQTDNKNSDNATTLPSDEDLFPSDETVYYEDAVFLDDSEDSEETDKKEETSS